MNTFEITVQRQAGDGWPVVAELSGGGALLPVRAEGLLRADLEDLKARLNGQGTPREYGTLLGQAVFQGAVRDALVRALARSDERLHVLLFVEAADSPAAELAATTDDLRRLEREIAARERHAERERQREAEAPLLQLCELTDILARAALVLAGFRQHARGEWRRCRETERAE